MATATPLKQWEVNARTPLSQGGIARSTGSSSSAATTTTSTSTAPPTLPPRTTNSEFQ